DAGGNAVPVTLESAGKMHFAFQKSEVTEIQVFFSQPYWFDTQGKREFVYGFQEIEVKHLVMNGTEAELVTEFSLEGTTKRFSSIQPPSAVALAATPKAIDELVEHKLYYSKDLSSEFSFGNEIMAPSQKVYIKTTIRGQGEVTPMIRQLELDYTYREIDEF